MDKTGYDVFLILKSFPIKNLNLTIFRETIYYELMRSRRKKPVKVVSKKVDLDDHFD